MTAMPMPISDLFSVITLSEPGARSPAWKAMLGWPGQGEQHLDHARDTPAQRNIWATRLDEAVMHAERPVLLVAGGASCLAAAWWARLSPAFYVQKVAGALLFAPGGDADAAERFASPRIALPFPSAIVEGSGPRHRLNAEALALAEGWGSRFVELGSERASGPAWQQAQTLLLRMTAGVIERRMRVAGALGVEV